MKAWIEPEVQVVGTSMTKKPWALVMPIRLNMNHCLTIYKQYTDHVWSMKNNQDKLLVSVSQTILKKKGKQKGILTLIRHIPVNYTNIF